MSNSQSKTAAARREKSKSDDEVRLRNRRALLSAAEAMVSERDANGGVYPHHNGEMTMLEVCARAGLSEGTIYKSGYRDLRGPIKDCWASSVEQEVAGTPSKRKSDRERAKEWEKKHDAALDRLRIVEQELLELRIKLGEGERKNPHQTENGNLVWLHPRS